MHNCTRRTNRYVHAALATGFIAVAAPAWGQVIHEDTKLLANDGVVFDRFGLSIAIDNGIVAVGADLHVHNGPDSGSAYLFDASTGAQIAELLPSDAEADDRFGVSIAIDDGVVAVGAWLDDDNGSESGSAYLFDASTGAQIAKLLPRDGAAGDQFGVSIAIDNGVVAVGAWDDDGNNSNSGTAYLFDASTGAQIAKLTPSDGTSGDLFGCAIAIDNGIVAVGAWHEGDTDPSQPYLAGSGSAYLFNASTGAQIAKLGFSIAIDNGVVAIGAPHDDDNGGNSGSAYLFDASTGTQIAKLLPTDGGTNDNFGVSISIANGVVAVGAFYEDENGFDSGSAYLFNASTGAQIAKLLASDAVHLELLGRSIAIDNGVVAVGAPDVGPETGSAYIFDASVPCAGDLDVDGQSDLADFAFFAGCMSGPGQPVSPGCEPTDMDGDGDADMDDFRLFQVAFGCQ